MLSKPVWYVLAALAVLAPVGVRVVTANRAGPMPVDPVMAKAGEELFNHEWTPNDPLANGGDGLGPVFNAKSCVFCHEQSRPGGGGGLEANVTTFAVRTGPNLENTREGVLHKFGGDNLASLGNGLPNIGAVDLKQLALTPAQLRDPGVLRLPRGVRISQLNTPALFGTKEIDQLSDKDIIANETAERMRYGWAPAGGTEYPVGRATRTASGKVGRFGWKAQTATLGAFVRAACANELGLGNPSQAQPAPLNNPNHMAPGLDLTENQCEQLTAFVASLPRPTEVVPSDPVKAANAAEGKKLFASVGCADCHKQDLGNAKGIYSDLLVHHMGADLEGGGSYYDTPLPAPPPKDDPSPEGPAAAAEWRTPPLWGVADSAPYMHDGRADTLDAAIRMHTGQGAASAARYGGLGKVQQNQLVEFLNTLKAPPPAEPVAAAR